MNMPSEVKEYFENGQKKIVSIKTHDNYTMDITFDDGVVKRKDFTNIIETGVFTVLKDIKKFHEAFIDDRGNLAWDIDSTLDSDTHWNNRIDLCKDSLYIYSEGL